MASNDDRLREGAESPKDVESDSSLEFEEEESIGEMDTFDPGLENPPEPGPSIQPAHQPYQYRPLKTADSIRTLEILPGASSDPIQITLNHRNMSQISDCLAVSYEWGEPVRDHTIFCEGRDLKVTTNLLAFLKQFRAKPASKPLWIDALCINQDDLEERAQQITLMRVIYHDAACVISWLGEAGRVSRGAIEIVQDMASIYESLSSQVVFRLSPAHQFKGPSNIPCGSELEAFTRDPSWAGVLDLFLSRSYFQRLWIIQEVILASRLLFVRGGHHIELHSFRHAAILLYSCEFLTNNREDGHDLLNLLFVDRILSRRAAIKQGEDKLSDLVRTFSFALCSDPRDRIYGFLGLLPIGLQAPSLVADYTKSIHQVFREATEYILVQEQRTDPWSLLDLDLTSRSTNAPSWVPYYDERRSVNVLSPSFKDSLLESSPKITFQDGALTIHGLILDSISHASKNCSFENIENVVLSFISDLAARSQQAPSICLSGIWQALVAFSSMSDDGPKFQEGFFDFISILPEFRSLLPNPSQRQPSDRTQQANPALASKRISSTKESATLKPATYFKNRLIFRMLGETPTLGRNVFQTSAGYFGIGPAGRNDINASAVQPGDCIAVMPSALYPLVLRPCEDGMYTLVGKGYIACPESPPWFKEGNVLRAVPIRIR